MDGSSSAAAEAQSSPQNPQSTATPTTTASSAASISPTKPTTTTTTTATKHRRDLPPLFWYMELGDWAKATARAKSHPKEVKTRATLRTKSMSVEENGTTKVATKRLALHHACFKLRSTGSAPIPVAVLPQSNTSSSSPTKSKASDSGTEDPFLAVCKFILLLLEIYPEACQVRESRHGCLPLHLAAFASCYVRTPSPDDDDHHQHHHHHTASSSSVPMPKTPVLGESCRVRSSSHFRSSSAASAALIGGALSTASNSVERPGIMSVRSTSESTTSTVHSNMTNMTAILMEESFAAAQTQRKKDGTAPPPLTKHAAAASPPAVSSSSGSLTPTTTTTTTSATTTSLSTPHTIFISNKREQMAVKVLNAMLDAHPRAIRLDSEGGRLPLHTACAGRATPRCVSLLLRAYPAASRHRNKDGFLPLHLAAHWGVSHPNVAITLLKAYPDATVGRNRWERTPLEEALVMAGENGRPHQAPLVRALRKHPSYWTRPPKELFQANNLEEKGREQRLVDMDETLASNDDETSVDDNPNYFNAGHSVVIE